MTEETTFKWGVSPERLPRQYEDMAVVVRDALSDNSPVRFLSVAACSDIHEPLKYLREVVDEFWFCDLFYFQKRRMRGRITEAMSPWRLIENEDEVMPLPIEMRECVGPTQRTGHPQLGRSYRYVEPVVHSYRFQSPDTGRDVTVKFRNGCGAYALHREFEDGSLSIFMHRADNPFGDGGSLLSILGHEGSESPVPERRQLHATLMQKLTAPGIIISDGCCTKVSGFNIWDAGQEPKPFVFGDHTYTPIAELDKRRFRTFAWRVDQSGHF